MRSEQQELADEFTTHRGHLIAVAYRLTGTVSDAEDAMQETWLRLSRMSKSELDNISNLEAWLTTVVSRICLDRLRSAHARRERYVGQWLPEPIVTTLGEPTTVDPLTVAVHDDSVRMAAMVVLDKLSPEQRVAFVLHDAFSVPFGEIGTILGCTAAAARQHGSRGRKAVTDAAPPSRASMDQQRDVLERLMSALKAGDIDALTEVLHPDAVLIGDSNGKARTSRQIMVGADKIGRFLRGLLTMYVPGVLSSARPVLVNGDLGLYLPTVPGDQNHHALDARVQAMSLRDGKILAIYDVVNPDKLTRIPEET